MIKLLSSLLPLLLNFVNGGVFYITAQRFTDAGVAPWLIAAPLTIWSLVYCLMNLWIGRITTERNAAKLVAAGGLVIAASALGFLLLPAIMLQLLWSALVAVGAAFYCAPIQVFMKSLEQGEATGVARATGIYTASWSIGFACGPAVFGLFSAATGFWLCFAVGIFITVTITGIDRFRTRTAPQGPVAEGDTTPEPPAPDLAWVGWIVGGIGTLTICQIRTMWQPLGASLALPKEQVALILALVSYVQGGVALILAFAGNWCFRRVPALLTGAAGVLALLGFACGKSLPLFYAAGVLYGIYSGCFYFYFVFYSLCHPTKSARYVGINEIVVALTGIVGPQLGSMLASAGNPAWPFFCAALVTFGATVVHVIAVRRAQIQITGGDK